MQILMKWVAPIAFAAVGIAVYGGLILKAIPGQTGLHQTFGVVIVLFGVYRFVAARIAKRANPRRRFGGGRSRPWENDDA
jgi:uncharacterized membrane protein YfcA